MDPGFVVLGIAVLGIGLRLVAGLFDDGRVRNHIESRGGTLLEKRWNPFGRGWFGEKDSRIYRVRYTDAEGNLHQATCKTSLLSGVYFTEDLIVEWRQPQPDDEAARLAEENRRLREELARLRDGKS